MNLWISKDFAESARGRRLASWLDAATIAAPPAGHGVWLACAEQFQDAEDMLRKEWLAWCAKPGRTLVLLPPFRTGKDCLPGPWRASLTSGIPSFVGEAPRLTRLTAGEIRHRIEGKLPSVPELGEAADGALTRIFRPHPHAGVFAVTALPLWSLVLLDHGKELHGWLRRLHGMSGEPLAEVPESEAFRAKPDHYTVLLHLADGSHVNRQAALESLRWSPRFELSLEAAQSALADLENEGFAAEGRLTNKGRDFLLDSPYAPFARALLAAS